MDVSTAVRQFEGEDFVCLLHSAGECQGGDPQQRGRYSFLSANPFLKITAQGGKTMVDGKGVAGDPFQVLGHYLQKYRCAPLPDLPPMQGGAMGWFGYELGSYLEDIPAPKNCPVPYGDMAVGFFDWVIAFDHLEKSITIIANTLVEKAENIISFIERKLQKAPKRGVTIPQKIRAVRKPFTMDAFVERVQKAIDYIYAGDVFQVNVSQPFYVSFAKCPPVGIYLHLSRINPAPFSAYLDCGDVQIASSSPERFLRATPEGLVETCPIKGTYKRGKTSIEDRLFKRRLRTSAKNRAENIMIVDLMRNDLSKVCGIGSVEVQELCALETYPSVHHLVSMVRGRLCPEYTSVDLLKACYPGGSITGAPKIRAQEIIAELEVVKRGIYCGSIGYISFSGSMDTNIAIRTMVIQGSVATINAGGGIVSDSKPQEEYWETMLKAKKLFQVFGDDPSYR